MLVAVRDDERAVLVRADEIPDVALAFLELLLLDRASAPARARQQLCGSRLPDPAESSGPPRQAERDALRRRRRSHRGLRRALVLGDFTAASICAVRSSMTASPSCSCARSAERPCHPDRLKEA